MLFAIHADALFEAVCTDSVELERLLLTSKIVASEEIIDLFEKKFSESPTYAQLLQSLLSKLGTVGQIKYVSHLDDVDDIKKYEEAAYAGGKNLAVLSSTKFTPTEKALIQQRGSVLRLLDKMNYAGAKIGFEPFEMHTLPHNQKKHPLEVIGRFFKESSKVIFYDKFINEKSCCLINCLSQQIAKSGIIDIVTSSEAPLNPKQIREKITLRPGQKLQVELASSDTVKLLHDRYCYIDDMYEIHIPRGLDCFGHSPGWKTVNANIYVYDCQHAVHSNMICQPRAGRPYERSIPFKTCLLKTE